MLVKSVHTDGTASIVARHVRLIARAAIDSVEFVSLDVSQDGGGHSVKILVGIIILTDDVEQL